MGRRRSSAELLKEKLPELTKFFQSSATIDKTIRIRSAKHLKEKIVEVVKNKDENVFGDELFHISVSKLLEKVSKGQS